MKLNIALLPGDGIGPEVICQAVKSVEAVCRKFGHEVSWHFAYAGACAIDRYGERGDFFRQLVDAMVDRTK